MSSNDTKTAAPFPPQAQEVFLPRGGTDPDFYMPAEWGRGERSWMKRIHKRLRLLIGLST
ncbi:hypothetical protein NicSoilB11_43030 (plasmid) [Arthrobacter sp. NicSoilB11]|jgi:hypothetical protein|nr:hypothetical protein NicSoilB11_43030 [Arthrobacter sp. NicSoilB11]